MPFHILSIARRDVTPKRSERARVTRTIRAQIGNRPRCGLVVSLLSWREAIYYDAATTMSEAVRTMMRMDAEAQVDAGFLWDFWYPAARSMEIRGQKLEI